MVSADSSAPALAAGEEIHDTNGKRPGSGAIPTPPVQPIKPRPPSGRNKFRIARPEGEHKLYTHEEDVGGYGRKNSLLRNVLDASNPTKTSWESRSARFHDPKPLTDKFYEDDGGLGLRKCSIKRLLQDSPRKYAADFTDTSRWAKPPTVYGSGKLYDTTKVAGSNKGDMETECAHTARNYRTSFESQKGAATSRDYDFDYHASHPEYDFGDGPKQTMNSLMLKSGNKVSTMNAPRSYRDTVPNDQPVLVPEFGAHKPMVKQVLEGSNQVSSMRSALPRFSSAVNENSHLDWRAQDKGTVADELEGGPVKYAVVSTKTPRFTPREGQLGRDFYDWTERRGPKQNLSFAIEASDVNYNGTIGSKTPRFKKEKGDSAGDSCYDTNHLHKSSLVKGVKESAIKYSVIKSRVPRFDPGDSAKSKLKKLDLDAIYEAELRRVTGQREPAEYYIPDYGTSRGVAQSVSHSKLTYKSCFGSKVPRFEHEKNKEF